MPGLISLARRPHLTAAAAILLTAAGCSRHISSGPIQVMFYSPDGASIILRNTRGETMLPIRSRGPVGDRLERAGENLAVFDLSAGKYQFAYSGAPGAEDAVIYGQLELNSPQSPQAREICRHAGIPFKLPSLQAQVAEHRHPSRDLSYTVGLEEREFEHIRQGDVISKVYFVADLARAQHERDVTLQMQINDINRHLEVLADRETYLQDRYIEARRRALQRDPEMNISDRLAQERFDRWGIEEPFIKLAEKKNEVIAEREHLIMLREQLIAEQDRRNALLRSMKIIHRNGALVLATPDLQLPFHDTLAQAADLGDVVAVLTVGGRHQRWASPMFAALNQPSDMDSMSDMDMNNIQPEP